MAEPHSDAITPPDPGVTGEQVYELARPNRLCPDWVFLTEEQRRQFSAVATLANALGAAVASTAS